MHIELSDIKSFEGKVALITGGASGIGHATAQLLASKGAKVVVGDLRQPQDAFLPGVEFVEADTTSWSSQLSLFKGVIQKHGKIDIVHANAAIAEGDHPFEDRVDPATGDPIEPTWLTIKVNLIGKLITTKLAIHFLKKQASGGSIVVTGSRASYECHNMPAYTVSKHGILGMLRAVRAHTPAWNIRINLVAPGITFTPLLPQHTSQEYDRLGLYKQTPEDVARAVAYLAQESSLNGKAISISQGVYRELEEHVESVRDKIFGEDDWSPSNEDELQVLNSVISSRW